MKEAHIVDILYARGKLVLCSVELANGLFILVSYTDFIALAPSRQTCLSGGSERNKVCVRDYIYIPMRKHNILKVCHQQIVILKYRL